MKFITLKKDYQIKLKSQITKFYTPKYVYLPMDSEELLNHLEIKKEESIIPSLISPISGKIIGMEEKINALGEKKKCLVIENNYKETLYKKHGMRKNLNKITQEELIQELNNYNEKHLAELFYQEESQILLINTIESEPYVANETFITTEFTNLLLETIDVLKTIGNYQKVWIAIQNNCRDNIESINHFLGTYPTQELKLVPDYYLLSHSKFLKQYLNISENIVLLKPSEIKKIYNILKRRRHTTEHIFTISGDGIENPQVIEAKIGSSIKEIMEKLIQKKKEKKLLIYVNGLMRGKTLEIENMIVTQELQSILIMEEKEITEKKCINCGKCYQICPVGCNPRAFLDSHKKSEIENCIDCGLCSYICPSFINLRKIIQGEYYE